MNTQVLQGLLVPFLGTTLGADGLKAVTLDLGGGKLGDESSIQIIVETGSVFTAPASDGLTRPDGNTGNYFMWRTTTAAKQVTITAPLY